jgi:hypothetical protein
VTVNLVIGASARCVGRYINSDLGNTSRRPHAVSRHSHTCCGVIQVTESGQMCHGPNIATDLLHQHSNDSDLVDAVARMCTGACAGCEETKCKLMESRFPAEALALIDSDAVSISATAMLCTALKALMFNDDTRPPASQAFTHARAYSGWKRALCQCF